MAGPRKLVDGPRFTPSAYGLLSVAELRGNEQGDTHWQNGVTFETTCPNLNASTATTFDECIAVTGVGAPSPPPAKADNTNQVWRGATPFTIYAEFDCSAVGLAAAESKARDALAIQASWQIERALWTGQAAGVNNIAFPHLAHAGQAVLDAQGITLQSPAVTGVGGYPGGGGPWPVAQGVGILEKLMADCLNGVGVVHVPVQVLPELTKAMAVTVRGQSYYTPNGNQLAVGNGYPGTGPAGQAPNQDTAWIFGTGPVVVYRGEPRVIDYGPEAFDRAENTMRLLAEQTCLAAWSCCQFAVQLTLTA